MDGTWTGTEPQVVLTCGIYIPYLLFACNNNNNSDSEDKELAVGTIR